MKTHADKTQENRIHSVANEVSQKHSTSEFTFQFVENRPEAIVQRKLQDIANNSPQVEKLTAFQAIANRSPQENQYAQLQAIMDNYVAREQQIIQNKKNKTSPPESHKSGVDKLSRYSIHDAKAPYNSDKPAQFQAHAYAQGTDIHIASGQEKQLPREAWREESPYENESKDNSVIQLYIVSLDDLQNVWGTSKAKNVEVINRLYEIHTLQTGGRSRVGSKVSESKQDLDTIDPSMEDVIITAHGSTSTVGASKLTPGQLAADLKSKKIKDGTTVILGACSGGVNGVTSYAKQLHTALTTDPNKRTNIIVKAVIGISTIKASGSYRAIDEAILTGNVTALGNILDPKNITASKKSVEDAYGEAIDYYGVYTTEWKAAEAEVNKQLIAKTDFEGILNSPTALKKIADEIQPVWDFLQPFFNSIAKTSGDTVLTVATNGTVTETTGDL